MLSVAPFRPLPFLSNRHIQTLGARFKAHRDEHYPVEFTKVPLADGDQLSVATITPDSWNPTRRTVLLYHGWGGHQDADYMTRTTFRFHQLGFRVIRPDHRGCGHGQGLARLPHHAGRTDDLRAVLRWHANIAPTSPITAIGFSYGGTSLLNLATEDGSTPTGTLDSIAAVSAPLDLRTFAELLDSCSFPPYREYILKKLIPIAEAMEPASATPLADTLSTDMMMTLYDAVYTAPRAGFSSVEEYWRATSPAQRLSEIRIPALVIAAEDDPVVPFAPYRELEENNFLTLALSAHGGHCGFLGRTSRPGSYRWVDETLLAWTQTQGS